MKNEITQKVTKNDPKVATTVFASCVEIFIEIFMRKIFILCSADQALKISKVYLALKRL